MTASVKKNEVLKMQWTQAKLQEQSDEQRDSRKSNSSEYMISIKKNLASLKMVLRSSQIGHCDARQRRPHVTQCFCRTS